MSRTTATYTAQLIWFKYVNREVAVASATCLLDLQTCFVRVDPERRVVAAAEIDVGGIIRRTELVGTAWVDYDCHHALRANVKRVQ